MPCYRCGTRQVDPDRGSSPWLRGVKADRQVLICPGCQAAGEWLTDLDRCHVCASVRLVRRLGEVECRDCGHIGESAATGESATVRVGAEIRAGSDLSDALIAPGLAEEVEQALAKVLRRAIRVRR
jgi:hypothetical protein